MIYMNTGPTLQLQWNTISLPYWPSKDKTELTNSSMSWLKTNGFKQSNPSMNWTEFGCLIDFLKFPAKRKTRTTWKWKINSGWKRLKITGKNRIFKVNVEFEIELTQRRSTAVAFPAAAAWISRSTGESFENVRLLKIRSCSRRWSDHQRKKTLPCCSKQKVHEQQTWGSE